MLVCALCCVLPARALASGTQESLMMDDQKLIYSDAAHVARTLSEMKALGVDRVKVSVVWSLVAPAPTSTREPKFDATNPAAYPPGVWARWDRVLTYAHALGMTVYFQIVPPGPAWALGKGTPSQGYPWSQTPSPSAFGKFVEAVARRYSGNYVASASDRVRAPRDLLPITIPGLFPTPSDPAPPLPRVDYWGIWNEPNEAAWLNPQWKTVHGKTVYTAPAMYRRLVDAAYHAFRVTGHGSDTFLVGEIASRGWIYPLAFVRDLYCISSSGRPLRGSAAATVQCPTSGDARKFAERHPGLFAFPAFAYHPYSFDVPPDQPEPDPNWITLADMWRLERTLDRAYAAHGQHPHGGVSMYLTEFGYKSDPPNPYVKTSLSEQATWLNQAEYMAYRDPRVKAMDQFLLVDSAPDTRWKPGSRAYWGTFQSGLKFVSGKVKPSYAAWRIPIWVPVARHGRRVTVWGHLRPADHGQLQYAELDYRAPHSRTWTALRVIQTANSEGFLVAHVPIGARGSIRLAWLSPGTGRIFYSRTVGIS
jgi:hypothetical protein